MNNGGDAAEQVVRLSLEGFEVAARLSGSAAKNIALLLVSVLKQEQKTKGKANGKWQDRTYEPKVTDERLELTFDLSAISSQSFTSRRSFFNSPLIEAISSFAA